MDMQNSKNGRVYGSGKPHAEIDDDLAFWDCLRIVCKATRYDAFVEKLSRGLSGSFDNNVRPAVLSIIEKLKLTFGRVTDHDIGTIEPVLNKFLGDDVANSVEKELDLLTKNLYNEAVRFKSAEIGDISEQNAKNGRIGMQIDLNMVNSRAVDLLNRANIVWIGDNDLKSKVGNDLTAEMVKARQLKMTRKDTAILLERKFGPLVPAAVADKYGTARYWDGFARQHATRTRVFADLEVYKAAGITKFQIWSRLNEQTCAICGRLHGTVFKVSDGISMMKAFYTAAQNNDVAGMKRATPWVYAVPAPNVSPSTVVPPLHFRCHCHTRAFREEIGKHESANEQVNLSESGKKVKFKDFGDKVINGEVLYSVLDPFNRNVVVTKQAISHIEKGNNTPKTHLKFGKTDLDNYKNIPEAIKDYVCIAKGKTEITYIGKNGYVVVCKNNMVITSYFANYGGDTGVLPVNLSEAITKAKEYYKKKKEGRKEYELYEH